MSARHFDIAVIGAGSGGLTLAAAAAQFGRRVVLFEKAEMGGDCLNTGCVPSKALIAAGAQAQAMREAARFGIEPIEPQLDFAAVMASVKRAIAAIAPHDSQQRMEQLGITVVRAAARFRDARTLEAAGGGFTARRIVIATGARPAVPPIPGLADVPFLTSETLFDNTVLPAHLVVIGGGAIGLEMAQAHRRLGSRVTVIEAATPLAQDDPELSAVVLRQLAAEGIEIVSATPVTGVARTAQGISVTAGGRSIEGSHLLVAAGRRPAIDGLNLEAAGIAFSARGIDVDAGLRTTNRKVFAIGDVAGGRFTHEASYQAGIVLRRALFGLPARATSAISQVIYTAPELAQVGLTEAQARSLHGDAIAVLRAPFSGNDRAVTEADTQGLVKVIAGPRGRLLGAGIAGAGAGDLIQPWVVALHKGLKLGDIASLVLPYPTRGEASKRAAIGYFAGLASKPLLRGVMGLVSRIMP